jgi:hypothetical protein
LTLEPQPSTSTAKIEPEQQEQMEIYDIDPNFCFAARRFKVDN